MCQRVIHYTTHSLQTIRKSSTQTSNYGLFHLDRSIRSYIIALGIWRTITDKPYRRSRAGQQLFHKIHSKISQKRTMSSTERGLGTQILNLIQIKLKNTTLMLRVLGHPPQLGLASHALGPQRRTETKAIVGDEWYLLLSTRVWPRRLSFTSWHGLQIMEGSSTKNEHTMMKWQMTLEQY